MGVSVGVGVGGGVGAGVGYTVTGLGSFRSQSVYTIGRILPGGEVRCLTPPPYRAGFLAVSLRHQKELFRDFFGSSEPGDCCATFLQPRLPLVRLLVAAIRDFLVFGFLGDLAKFRRPVCGPDRPKTAQKSIFPVLGAVLRETPVDQI